MFDIAINIATMVENIFKKDKELGRQIYVNDETATIVTELKAILRKAGVNITGTKIMDEAVRGYARKQLPKIKGRNKSLSKIVRDTS